MKKLYKINNTKLKKIIFKILKINYNNILY